MDTNKKIINAISSNRVEILTVFFLSVLYCLTIIMADRSYIDDLNRTTFGFYSWIGNARPFADAIMMAINFGGENTDLSPMPLLIGLLSYSIVSVLYIRGYANGTSRLITVLLSLSLLINPFFLQNLSYKYDSLPMLISVCLLIIPFISKSSGLILSCIYSALISISLGMYQASVGIFASLAVLEVIKIASEDASDIRLIYRKITQRVIEFFVGLVIFMKVITPLCIPHMNKYTILHSQTITATSDGVDSLRANVVSFYDILIAKYLASVPDFLMIAVVLSISLFVLMTAYSFFRECKSSVLSKIPVAIIIILSPLILITLSFIAGAVLKEPVIESRVMVPFSAVTLLIAFPCIIKNNLRNIHLAIYCVFFVFSFVYSFSYGNAVKHIGRHEEFVSSMILNDISEIDPMQKMKIQTQGSMKIPPSADNILRKYPLMLSVIPRHLNGNWIFATVQLNQFGRKINRADMSQDAISKGGKEIVFRTDYSIIKYDDTILIRFNKH